MRTLMSCVGLAAAGAVALGQSATPAAFVANNGNVEGSVTSFRVNDDGTLAFVQKLVLGSGSGHAANNAYAISITPDGRFLAVSHATAATVTERISLLRVNADATISLAQNLSTPDSPLDLAWLDDAHLAITRTRTSGTNQVILYAFDDEALTITEIGRVDTGSFTSNIAVSPDGAYLFANDSPLGGGGLIRSYAFTPGQALAYVGAASTGTTYVLGMGLTPDSRYLYAGGGASSPYRVAGMANVDGVLVGTPGAPYATGGVSPKECVASPDGAWVYAGHGTDATIRAFAADAESGVLTDAGLVYDVGGQSSLGDIAAMRLPGGPDLLLFTDKETFDGTPRGLFSAVINPDGSLTVMTTRLDTLGVSPNDIAVWAPPAQGCIADFNGSGGTPDDADIAAFFLAWNAGDPRADVNASGGTPDDADIAYFFLRWNEGC